MNAFYIDSYIVHKPSPVAQNRMKSCLKFDLGVGSKGLAVHRAMAGGGKVSEKSSISSTSKWL